MKICFLYESAFTLGGIQRCITILSNYLIEKGYDVSIICTNNKVPINRDTYGLNENVKVIFCESNTIKRALLKWKIIFKKINYKYGLFKNNYKILKMIYYPFYRSVRKILEQNKYDIVIGCGPYMNTLITIFSKINGTKKIGWQHHCHKIYFETPMRNYYNQDAIVKKMFTNLDKYIVLTKDDKMQINTKFGYDVEYIYNALSFRQIEKSKLENKKFISVGRLDKIKGFDILINNFKEFNKRNKEWTLDIVGEGPERDNLQKLINSLDLQEYVNILPKTNKINELYKKASIYCMSSRQEGFPMVSLEALESGLPIISYAIPCSKELLEGVGIIVPVNDHANFVDAMYNLAIDYEKRKELAEKSIERAKDFYIEKIGIEWEKLFKELMEENV